MMTSQFQKDPWLLAEKRYLDGLSDEEKELFKSASLENLFYSTSAAQIRHKENSKSRAAAKKLQPIVAAISQYGSAVDVMTNTASLVLCPLWGSIRVVLHIASEFDKYYSKLVEMLERIGDVILRFKSYERLFPTHESLIHSLSLVYLDVLEFCIQAKNLFQKAKMHKYLPGSGLRAMKLLWKPFKEDFGDVIGRFRQNAEKVELEVQLSHMIEASAEREAQGRERESQALERAIMETERKRQWLVRKEKDKKGLLQGLSTYNYEWKHRQVIRKRHPDTGKWILASSGFCSWIEGIGSSCLWCYGIPGSGKSILTSIVIDTIKRKHVSDKALLTYFYCDYSDSKTLETREILGSLIQQLLDKQKISHKVESQLQEIYADSRIPDVEDLFKTFSMVVRELPKVFVVVDGLDECKEKDRDYLLPWLKRLVNLTRVTVKLFIASREDVDIKKIFGDCYLIAATPENVSADISSVVEDIVNTKVEEEKICVRDPRLVREIIDALVKGAQGMFLWVKFQIDDICEELSEDGVRNALKRLPVGLNETYTRALTKILARGKPQVDVAHKAFRWMVHAKRTLSLGELQEAVAIDISDKSFDERKVPEGLQLIRACGNLAVYDPYENTIRLAHYTVQQFFLSPPTLNEVGISAQLADFHFRDESTAYFGIVCMTYLMFSDFETQVTQRKTLSLPQVLLLGSPTTRWVPAMAGFNKSQSDIWNLLRKARFSSTYQNPNIDFDRHLYLMEKPSGVLQQKYRFLNYVISHWIEHACLDFYSEGWDTTTRDLFEKLVMERKTLFDFRPWGESCSSGDFPHRNLFRWAIENGNEVLVSVVLSAGRAKEDPLLRGQNQASYWYCKVGNEEFPFAYAARCGYEGIIMLFLGEYGIIAASKLVGHLKEGSVGDVIRYALWNGTQGIVLLLLKHFYAVLVSLERRGIRSPMDKTFYSAVKRGYVEVVDLLISHYDCGTPSTINWRDEKGFTLLHHASKGGHLEVVKILVKCEYTNINEEANDSSTALYLAARFGHDKIVDIFLRQSPTENTLFLPLLDRLLVTRDYPTLNLLLDIHQSLGISPHLAMIIKSGNRSIIWYVLNRKGKEFKGSEWPSERTIIHLFHESPRGVGEVLKWAKEENMLSVVAHLLPAAVESNAEELVEALLGAGVDVGTQNADGWTPICLAAAKGYESIARKLLASGAATTANSVGRTPLYYAAQSGHNSVVRILTTAEMKTSIEEKGS